MRGIARFAAVRRGVAGALIGNFAVIHLGHNALETMIFRRRRRPCLTRDVALAFRISFEEALLVKEEYGSATSEYTACNSVVEVASPGDETSRELPRRLLNQIIEARAGELFEKVRDELRRVGMERSLVVSAIPARVSADAGGGRHADIRLSKSHPIFASVR